MAKVMARATGALLLAALLLAVSAEVDEEFLYVTCGSALKLTHKATGAKLHSHEIPYGTGSGQQSVTGFPENNDPNSYFAVDGGHGNPTCERGVPIKCNSVVRLRHQLTGRLLHSHRHVAPLSGKQEVSCYGDWYNSDDGDNWIVECIDTADTHWTREKGVRLKHKDTGLYLAIDARFRYSNPIPGQLEVHAKPRDANAIWMAMEGLYIADKNY